MSDFLHRFARDFTALNADNLELLSGLYSPDVNFRDPFHEISGLASLQRYFSELYANTSDIGFTFYGYDQLREGAGYLRWTLHYRHPRLADGRPIRVEGCSYLEWHERVYLHQDYFDAGALLYEQLPVMGRVIGWLKRRLA
ncbi:MAG: nuclear transport factor 2 family protein [Pseudomonas sp.]